MRFSSSTLCMGSLSFFLSGFLFYTVVSGAPFTELVQPNFTASNILFVDSRGTFLVSRNGTFKAAIFNPGTQQANFYLCVIHVASHTIIWSANRNDPVSNADKMNLTSNGITIADGNGNLTWSTPSLRSSVNALMLTEMGNLVLLDRFNGSLWQSFDNPTDTLVIGQHLPMGKFLSSSVSDEDLSTGPYTFEITASDAILQWHGQTYWKLSMDSKAYMDSNYVVEYMAINRTGLYLFSHNGSAVVIQVNLLPSNLQIAYLAPSGQFTISSLSGGELNQEFIGPIDECQIPSICGRIGLCANDNPPCSCPAGFHAAAQGGCLPGGSFSLPVACSSTNKGSQSNSSLVSYIGLGYGLDYFSIDFYNPTRFGVNLSSCQSLCSGDCSCLGIFYDNSSGSCYVLETELGSIISSDGGVDDMIGFIKVVAVQSQPNGGKSSGDQSENFPVAAIVAVLCASIFLSVAVGLFCWRKWVLKNIKEGKFGHTSSLSSGDLDAFYIPGLPQRFNYKELEVATDNFKKQIGSGGFGSVYKGMLPDKTVVAVKKITNLGIQGKRDFCTEIAVIGNIHHVNLVRLKGFCAQGRQRLLVYEYMNRGSLDQTLFGSGPVLEWQERFDVALGAARGLAYLHAGCEQKIIHCDVKPENILLQDHFQAKISDFGLSKLLSPEQSSLFTTMRGTRGYLAPEWLTNSAISEKTDVYSFGMVLFELVSGRKNCAVRSRSQSTDDNSSGQSSLSSGPGLVYFPLFALEMHEQGRYLELADHRLEGRVTCEEVEKLVRVALLCVHEDPSLRPNMSTVVSMLEGGIPIGEPRIESLNFLRFYGRRFTEASVIGEENYRNEEYHRENASPTSRTSGSHTAFFSYMASEQISGPR